MKVVCINTDNWKSIRPIVFTIGKIYDVYEISIYDDSYWIIDDNGEEWRYYKEWFKPLFEIRNSKIDKLLGE